MRRLKWGLAGVLALLAAVAVGPATADAPTITGFPNEIRTVDLAGYRLQTSYPLGANTGSTFEQDYLPGGTVSAFDVTNPGVKFVSRYVAMPVGNKMLMVTWYTTGTSGTTLTDVFVMNFQTGVVSDVAPVSSPPSLGTVRILERGVARIPPP